MIDSIFKRLSPATAEALHSQDIKKIELVDELLGALNAIKGDILITHLSLEKLYHETQYVHARLSHMERSMMNKGIEAKAKAAKNAATNTEEGGTDSGGEGGGTTTSGGESGGGSEGGASGAGSAGIAKVIDIGAGSERFNLKMSKIQEAKNLTESLLESIEKMSLRIKDSTEAHPVEPKLNI